MTHGSERGEGRRSSGLASPARGRGGSACSRLAAVAALAIAASGCGERLPDPEAQFRRGLDHLRAGSLADAYRELLPASWGRDLDSLLDRARGILDSGDLESLRAVVGRLGEEIAKAVEASSPPESGLRALGGEARRLPEIVGLGDERTFRSLDVAGILGRLDDAFFRRLVAQDEIRRHLEGARVRLVRTERRWARLSFDARDRDGRETREEKDVVLVDGKWVLNEWSVDWPKHMASLRARLDDLEARKRADPGYLEEALGSSTAVLEALSASLEPTLRALGGGASTRP